MVYRKSLQGLLDQGIIDICDYYFALSLARVFPKASRLTLISGALASQALSRGMIYLNISNFCKDGSPNKISSLHLGFDLPGFATWIKELKNDSGGCVYEAESDFQILGSDFVNYSSCPLILDEKGHLYLSKYFHFRMRLVENIRCRQACPSLDMDHHYIAEKIESLFEGQDPDACIRQKQAVSKALLNRFTLISGGPGTGKTHITRMISAQLKEHALKKGLPAPVILSLAPTGKAASRLENGVTIHSTLVVASNDLKFFYNKNNQLSADLVIVDEGSMIDLALMTRLFEAIPVNTRLVLLGDANQLPPVEAGAVFSELCKSASMKLFSTALTHNFRSQGKTGIEKLAAAIQSKDSAGVKEILMAPNSKDLVFHNTAGKNIRAVQSLIDDYIKKGYSGFLRHQDMESSIMEMDKFRILCAHNNGYFGTWKVNLRCKKLLHTLVDSDKMYKFFKQLVMITANNYKKGLFNGDTGTIILEDKNDSLKGIVGFPVPGSKEIKIFSYPDLPAHEPAFAVTIHKSQGSEFDHVLILLPDVISPVINRQLLYTALTRAREKAIIIGNLEVIQEAVGREPEQTCQIEQFL